MRRSIVIISLLVVSVFLSAQNPYKVDSLFNAYEKTGNLGCAVTFFNELKSLTDTLFIIKDKSKAEINSHMYYVYAKYIERRGLYTKSVHYALTGLEKAEKLKHINEEYAAEFYSLLCVCYHYLGSLDNAIANAEKCYEIDKRSGDKMNMISTLANIASLYDTSHKYDIAEKYLKQALCLVEELEDGRDVASLLGTASLIYLHKDDYEKAYEYAHQAYLLDSVAGRKDGAAIRQTQMADVLMKEGKSGTALQMYRNASYEFERDGNINYLSHCKEMLGDLTGALDLARKSGNMLYQRIILDSLAAKEKDADIALKYMNESCMLYDSISSIENSKMLEKFEVEYETIQKGNELEHQKAEINFQKTLWRYSHYIGIVLAVLVAVSGFGWIRNVNDKKKLDAINAVKDRMISIVSHDISGSVNETNMIAHMIDDKWKNETSKGLLAQCDAQKALLENLLVWVKLQRTGALQCKHMKLSVNDVVKELIEKFTPMAKAKDINLYINAQNECYLETDRYILTCILRNIISNAVKFTYPGGSVCIEVNENLISVIDTGIGITQNNLSCLMEGKEWIHTIGTSGESGTGLGLSIVRKMLVILGGRLDINSIVGCGSTFKILLPPKESITNEK